MVQCECEDVKTRWIDEPWSDYDDPTERCRDNAILNWSDIAISMTWCCFSYLRHRHHIIVYRHHACNPGTTPVIRVCAILIVIPSGFQTIRPLFLCVYTALDYLWKNVSFCQLFFKSIFWNKHLWPYNNSTENRDEKWSENSVLSCRSGYSRVLNL